MEDDERARLVAEAKAAANVENRLTNLEAGQAQNAASIALIWKAVGAAGLMIVASVWKGIEGVLFK